MTTSIKLTHEISKLRISVQYNLILHQKRQLAIFISHVDTA